MGAHAVTDMKTAKTNKLDKDLNSFDVCLTLLVIISLLRIYANQFRFPSYLD